MFAARALYRRFKKSLARLATRRVPDDEVLVHVALRGALLVTLGLAATHANIERLELCALAGLPLATVTRVATSRLAPRSRPAPEQLLRAAA